MRIILFGASGKIGRLVAELALERNYEVTAIVHNRTLDLKHQNLNIIKADIYNKTQLANILKNNAIIISTLSSWHTKQKDILSTAMKNIIPVAETNNITRLISLTGADARAAGDSLSFIHKLSHLGINLTNKKIMSDSESHLKLLEKSKLNWTVIRSPIMNNSGKAENFKLSLNRPLPWQTISRSSVALSMIDQIDDKKYINKAPYISRN